MGKNNMIHTTLRVEQNTMNKMIDIQMNEIKKSNKVIKISDILRKVIDIGIKNYEKDK